MSSNKTLLHRVLSLSVVLLAMAAVGSANEATSTSNGLTAAGGPLAIHGFDAVSYFSGSEPQRGLAEFSTLWNDAVYRFASKKNLRLFIKNPQKYAPRFGGFCAYGVSVGKKFDGDPEVFRIVDDRLYFNLNPEIKTTWEKDLARNIEKAEGQWGSIKNKPAGAL